MRHHASLQIEPPHQSPSHLISYEAEVGFPLPLGNVEGEGSRKSTSETRISEEDAKAEDTAVAVTTAEAGKAEADQLGTRRRAWEQRAWRVICSKRGEARASSHTTCRSGLQLALLGHGLV